MAYENVVLVGEAPGVEDLRAGMAGLEDVEYILKCVEEREALERAIRREGFRVERFPHPWPRDLWVHRKDRIVSVKESGPYGEGGLVISGPDFVIGSYALRKYLPPETSRPTSLVIKQRLMELYDTTPERTLVVATMEAVDHIGHYLLPIPQRKVLVVLEEYRTITDQRLQQNPSANCPPIDLIAENLGLETILSIGLARPFRPSSYKGAGNSFPINSLILEKPNGEVVIFTHEGGGLKQCLRGADIRVVEVPFSVNMDFLGGVRCATNTFPL